MRVTEQLGRKSRLHHRTSGRIFLSGKFALHCCLCVFVFGITVFHSFLFRSRLFPRCVSLDRRAPAWRSWVRFGAGQDVTSGGRKVALRASNYNGFCGAHTSSAGCWRRLRVLCLGSCVRRFCLLFGLCAVSHSTLFHVVCLRALSKKIGRVGQSRGHVRNLSTLEHEEASSSRAREQSRSGALCGRMRHSLLC